MLLHIKERDKRSRASAHSQCAMPANNLATLAALRLMHARVQLELDGLQVRHNTFSIGLSGAINGDRMEEVAL